MIVRLGLGALLVLSLATCLLVAQHPASAMGPPPSSCPNLYYASSIAQASIILPNGTSIDLLAHPNATFQASLTEGYTFSTLVAFQASNSQDPGSVYIYSTMYNFFSFTCNPTFPDGFTSTIHINNTFSSAGTQQAVAWGALTGSSSVSGDSFAEVHYTVDWVSSLPSTSGATTTVTIQPVTTTRTATTTATESMTQTVTTTMMTTSTSIVSTLGVDATTVTSTVTKAAATTLTTTKTMTGIAASTVTSTSAASTATVTTTLIKSISEAVENSSGIQSSSSARTETSPSSTTNDVGFIGLGGAALVAIGAAAYYVSKRRVPSN